MPRKYEPVDLSGLHTYSLSTRPSKVSVADFAKPITREMTVRQLLGAFPRILAGNDLRGLARAIRAARDARKPVIAGLGGHVIKCGLAPVLLALARDGFITAFTTSGAAIIHDFEIALAGATSEDVDQTLGSGQFGMADETGRFVNQAARLGRERELGLGEALQEMAREQPLPYAHVSMIATSAELGLPLTVHLAIGADIAHMHATADGAALGDTTHRDFRILTSIVRELGDGGVFLNLGSAVILPEVFLKAVTAARNLGHPLERFTTANLDFLQHYRPLTNVVRRPVAGVGTGYAITGHHELMIPLLAAAILEAE